MPKIRPESGSSIVIIPVPTADSLVRSWRERLDRSAARGLPAHVTLLHPFLSGSDLAEAIPELTKLCGRSSPFEVTFRRFGHFPGVLYLDPEPTDRFRQLTTEIAITWPEVPPYKGVYPDIIPHLTIADEADPDVMAQAERDIGPRLPLRAQIVEAALYTFEDAKWRLHTRMPLGGRGKAST